MRPESISLPASSETRAIILGALNNMKENARNVCATSDMLIAMSAVPAGIKELEKQGISGSKLNLLIGTVSSTPYNEVYSGTDNLGVFSDEMHQILNLAGEKSDGEPITPQTLMEAFMESGVSTAKLVGRIGAASDESPMEPSLPKPPKQKLLARFTIDMIQKARDGVYDPVIGRDSEIDEIVEVLARRRKRNVALTGEPGVGKSAVVEGLAIRMSEESIPKLEGTRILALSMPDLTAGTGIQGVLEERVTSLVREIERSDEDIVVFLDEGHSLAGMPGISGMTVGDMLKPALARGAFSMICATTNSEFKRIEQNAALARRFSRIDVQPIKEGKLVGLLEGIKSQYESYHGVSFPAETIESCASLSDRFMIGSQQPDKAVDLLDRTGARVAIERGSGEVSPEDVARVVADSTGIPAGSLLKDTSAQYLNIGERLSEHVIGHREVLSDLARSLKASAAGIRDRSKPIGTFLFCGPTGVGKTETAKALAREVFSDESSLIRIDMSEFRDGHSISRLIGAPPGYVGYGKGGELTEKVKRKPYSVVLFDEIEKAHPDVHLALLQVMDDGRLTDSEGTTVDFTNTVIIMTSNVGVAEAKQNEAGFSPTSNPRERIRKAVEKTFPPEFINRIDSVLVFDSLSEEQILQIARISVREIAEMAAEQAIVLNVEDEVVEKLAKEGFSPEQGARQLKRHIRSELEGPLSDMILDPSTRAGATVTFRVSKDGIKATRRNGR